MWIKRPRAARAPQPRRGGAATLSHVLGALSPQSTTPTQWRAAQTRTRTRTRLLSSGVSCLASSRLQNASSLLPCGWRDGPADHPTPRSILVSGASPGGTCWMDRNLSTPNTGAGAESVLVGPEQSLGRGLRDSAVQGPGGAVPRAPAHRDAHRPRSLPTPQCAQNSPSDPLEISEDPRAVQVTPAGGPWGCHESGQRPSCHPAGAGHLRGRGCGHCVPAPPIGGQRHLVSPAAGSSGCPSLDHRPGRVCVPKPVTSRMGKPSREGQEQTETTNTHTQSPRGFVFLRRGFSCLKPLRQMAWFPATYLLLKGNRVVLLASVTRCVGHWWVGERPRDVPLGPGRTQEPTWERM